MNRLSAFSELPIDAAKRIAGTKQQIIMMEFVGRENKAINIHLLRVLADCEQGVLRSMAKAGLLNLETGGKFGGSHRGTAELTGKGKSVLMYLKS